jgi:hypothetical protein
VIQILLNSKLDQRAANLDLEFLIVTVAVLCLLKLKND